MTELVRQRGAGDCGVAAVATLAGVSYETALGAVLPGRSTFHLRGTTTRQLAEGLRRLGYAAGTPLRRNLGVAPVVAIYKQRLPNTRNWHWVVYDRSKRKLYDPSRGYFRGSPADFDLVAWLRAESVA